MEIFGTILEILAGLVGSRTTPGTWPIIVTCLSGKSQGRLQTSFTVQ